MRQGQNISRIRLRLLALVLVLALFWYAMNPAPGPARTAKKADGPPDEESREAETPAAASYGLDLSGMSVIPPHVSPISTSHSGDADDLEWPDVIDF